MTAAHHELTDTELLEAHRRGDADAFGVLFTRHRDRLWAVALRTTGSPEDAADALQEAMISAFRRADSFRGDALVTTWLHRIVVNACLDRLRRNKVRAAQPLPDDLDEYAGRGAVVTSGPDADDPEAHAIRTDRRGAVIAALDQLPPDQKAAVVLVDLEGYPVEEVARMLDCPTGTVKSRCARGRARLAGLLRASGLDHREPDDSQRDDPERGDRERDAPVPDDTGGTGTAGPRDASQPRPQQTPDDNEEVPT